MHIFHNLKIFKFKLGVQIFKFVQTNLFQAFKYSYI